MQVCIHRGTKEIGGSCVEVSSQGKRIILDLGLPLDAKENDPKYLPNISGLDGNDESLLGILVSHPHLDHFGLLAHISEKVPVMMGKHARCIINAAAPFQRVNRPFPANGVDFENKKTFTAGPFQITPYLVDHSAYDAYSLLIEADGKKLFYSGDFRIHGRKASLTKDLMDHPPQDIDVMLLEGTCLSNENHNSALTEDDIEHQLTGIFNQAKGLVMVHASAQTLTGW